MIANELFISQFSVQSRIPGLTTGEEFFQFTKIKYLHLADPTPAIVSIKKVSCKLQLIKFSNKNNSKSNYIISTRSHGLMMKSGAII